MVRLISSSTVTKLIMTAFPKLSFGSPEMWRTSSLPPLMPLYRATEKPCLRRTAASFSQFTHLGIL
jgi:hypothetical protein